MKIFGIIGDPISHSLSPAMHNAALKKAKIRAVYIPLHVQPRELGDFVKKIGELHILGFNVTIPHKEAIQKYLHQISPEAKAIGAVNTVVVKNKKLHGYNTDAYGYGTSLRQETGFRAHKKQIVILGAGGAARAVLYALASQKPSIIYIANRTLGRAQKLAQEFQKSFSKVKIRPLSLEKHQLSAVFHQTHLVVNTTSVGLKNSVFKNMPLASLPKKAVVSDIVYRPQITPLLKAAQRHKLKIHPGLGMLLHQGALSYQLWTGRKPNVKVMKKALLDALKRK